MHKNITPLVISASSLVSALGRGKQATIESLIGESSGLRVSDYPNLDFNTWLGQVDAVDEVELETDLIHYTCRNNKLAKLALDTDNFREEVDLAIRNYGSDRIGVFMGTSTSGKAETENAYMNRDKDSGELPLSFDLLHTHNIGSVQDYVQHSLDLDGPGLTISTACSSSAKVFATAHRFIKTGLCDAAIVGGVDSFCMSTFYGFNALQLISDSPCRPWDIERNGINIGEAAGFALLEKPDEKNGVKLKGYGESSDAYHMSTPHPDGEGARAAMERAIFRAGLKIQDIEYVNLHGTATKSNDLAEAKALAGIFPDGVMCSSTKGFTGHTLGAAGITEALICALVLENDILPGTVNLINNDPELPIKALTSGVPRSVNNVMSNSLGFGGTNCSLVFGW